MPGQKILQRVKSCNYFSRTEILFDIICKRTIMTHVYFKKIIIVVAEEEVY